MQLQGEQIFMMVEAILVDNPHALASWLKVRRSFEENRELTDEEFDGFTQALENAYVWEKSGRPESELVVDVRHL